MKEHTRQTAPLPIMTRTPSPRVAIFVLVIIGFALLMVGRTDPAVFTNMRDNVLETLAPVFEAAAAPVRKIRAWRRTMDERSSAFEDNKRLKAEIEVLKADARQARTNAALVARYRALLNVQLDPRIDYVTARIIADTGGAYMRTLVLNAGRRAGIDIGQGVVDSNGLVGRIVALGGSSSRVLLVTDIKSRIPVILRPSNVHAMLVGDNSSDPTLEYVPNSAKAAVGEQVVTSGRGGLLPPNIPIGTISTASEGHGLVRVKLASDITRIDYVRVMRFSEPIDLDEEGVTPDNAFVAPLAEGPKQAPAAPVKDTKVQRPPAPQVSHPPESHKTPAETANKKAEGGPARDDPSPSPSDSDVSGQAPEVPGPGTPGAPQ